MKHLYVDTNVVLDLLLSRHGFVDDAERLFDLAAKGRAKLYLSVVSYTDIYYFVNKSFGRAKAISTLLELDNLTEAVGVSRAQVISTLKSDFVDFEDAVQHECALSDKRIDAIITRDRKGFKKSQLPIFSPTELLADLS